MTWRIRSGEALVATKRHRLARPGAEIAVMGASGAVEIIFRGKVRGIIDGVLMCLCRSRVGHVEKESRGDP